MQYSRQHVYNEAVCELYICARNLQFVIREYALCIVKALKRYCAVYCTHFRLGDIIPSCFRCVYTCA